MRAQTDKTQAATSKAAAGTARQIGQAKAAGKIADHRPTTIAQRKLQQAISSKVQQKQPAIKPISSPAGQVPVQRTEVAAIAAAHKHDNTVNNWAAVLAARAIPDSEVNKHWPEIITAYVAPPAGTRSATALINEAQALVARGEWAVLQRIKEANELLMQLQKAKATKNTLFLARLPNGAPALTVQQQIAIVNEMDAIQAEITSLQRHFMMPTRHVNQGGEVKPGNWVRSAKKATVLSFDGGVQAELYNKINPETGAQQSLGRGGFGYGRFGKVAGETMFVKKITLRTEHNISTLRARFNGINDPHALPADFAAEMSEGLTGELKGLRREAELTRAGGILAHRNILAVEAAGIIPGKNGKVKAYMVMEKMAGDASGLIKKGNIPRQQAIDIITGTLAAVNHMHANNYLHRDIKPDNIMIDSTGAPKLIDFGTAAVMTAGVYNSQAAEGTREFMHPSVNNGARMPQGGYNYRASTDMHALKLTFRKLLATSPELADIATWVEGIDYDNQSVADLLASFNFVA